MGTRAEIQTAGLSHPEDAKAVVPADDTDLPDGVALGLFVGTGGNVVVITKKGTTLTFKVPDGGYIDCQTARVKDTDTTAGDIVAFY